MIYEAWRITYQSSEAAARAAYNTVEKLHAELVELKEQMQAIGAGGVEHLFEFWWSEHMPDATQEKAWAAWVAAPEAKGVRVAAAQRAPIPDFDEPQPRTAGAFLRTRKGAHT